MSGERSTSTSPRDAGTQPSVRFRVEAVSEEQGAVLCRILEYQGFDLTPSSRLGGCSVVKFDLPRKLKPDGSPDLDVFAFWLGKKHEARNFRVGQEVELKNG